MNHPENHININILQRLFALILALNAFTFTVSAGDVNAKNLQQAQVELVEIHQGNTPAYYVNPAPSGDLYQPFILSREYKNNILSVQNVRIKVMINSLTRRFYSFRPFIHYFLIKPIPQSSGKDSSPSCSG